jgi:hypothetical protein
MSQKVVGMRLVYFFLMMLVGALVTAEGEEWEVVRVGGERGNGGKGKEGEGKGKEEKKGGKKEATKQAKEEAKDGAIVSTSSTLASSPPAIHFHLLYRRVGILFPGTVY